MLTVKNRNFVALFAEYAISSTVFAAEFLPAQNRDALSTIPFHSKESQLLTISAISVASVLLLATEAYTTIMFATLDYVNPVFRRCPKSMTSLNLDRLWLTSAISALVGAN